LTSNLDFPDDAISLYPTRLVVLSLLLIKSLLGDWDGASPASSSLPPSFVPTFASLLITRFLPLRQADLEAWNDDPEEWMNEEEMERWEFEVRPCAEFVLKALLSAFKEELGGSMVELLKQVSGSSSPLPSLLSASINELMLSSLTEPQSMDDLLLKEAVYTAIGRSPSDLEASIDFPSWLENTLVPECAGTDSKCVVLHS
jgi:hypothetical protein